MSAAAVVLAFVLAFALVALGIDVLCLVYVCVALKRTRQMNARTAALIAWSLRLSANTAALTKATYAGDYSRATELRAEAALIIAVRPLQAAS